jgi:hypothetical protein
VQRGVRLRPGDDAVAQPDAQKEPVASPAKAFPQHDLAKPRDEGADVVERVPSFPRDHKGLLRGVLGRASVVQDEIGELQHRARVVTQQVLEGCRVGGAKPRLVIHARHSIRGRRASEKFGQALRCPREPCPVA